MKKIDKMLGRQNRKNTVSMLTPEEINQIYLMAEEDQKEKAKKQS